MPTTTRQSTTDQSTPTPEVAEAAKAAAGETAAKTADAGSGAAAAARQIITAPVSVARALADDVVTTVRRPDAVLYVGGLVGLAVLGILDWPLAAVAGVGLAVANGRARA